MDDVRHKVDNDPDYIDIKRFGYSLKGLIKKYPDGVPEGEKGDKIIAQALQIPEGEVQEAYDKAVLALRAKMKVRV